ncbi:hypothetical protein B5E77_03885 [Lachnoclostridium sp. An131]|uniref:polysaccharide pyruvyl transferase family protein n=1 Tax=Lachnoclostridium sp. An131 TaxID=1965555 RepID=UPI000B372E47|nr:polysaccharide pyruvyl transferase family protein [Lachnoclostridium sp. An131]OUQ27966.1 hypothetical protein B5E77_03885 [Lachnoclostridium sp. An131]
MYKIGILTFYDSDNYGTCLQAFALSNIIRNLGYESNILNFNRKENSKKKSKISIIKKLGLKKTIILLISKKAIEKQKKYFVQFRNKLPITSKKYDSFNALKLDANKYNGFVTGSDMVWSWESKEFLDIYFLKFAPEGKKIAYAPSFGNSWSQIEAVKYYSKALKSIDFCSCRELNGVKFIEEISKKQCELVLDPTFLMTADEWKITFNLKEKNHTSKKIALCYMFGDLNKDFLKKLEKVTEKEYEIQYIPGTLKQYIYEYVHNRDVCGPSEFLQRYCMADVIITNTYHGLVFSLIFNKPFILLHRDNREYWVKHEERMVSLLNILGLSDRYLTLNSDISKKSFELDYTSINNKIESLRKSSKKYLYESLKKVSAV